ncbi:MAG TPA: hypothetical protein VKF15_08240 [Nitrososphaerales archaeon]|nr:hypothetical protein [Nitrososphaerales archaeon]
MVSRRYLYGAAAIVSAAAVGSLTGRLLVLQFLALTALVAVVAVYSLLRMDESVDFVGGQPVLRSRVTHYAQIAKVEDSGRLIRTASNPFERALLHRQGWSRISVGELRGLAERVPEDWEEPAAGSEKADR